MENILNKTKRVLQLRNYSPKTQKSYLFYIKEYIIFFKNSKIKGEQAVVEEFLLAKYLKWR